VSIKSPLKPEKITEQRVQYYKVSEEWSSLAIVRSEHHVTYKTVIVKHRLVENSLKHLIYAHIAYYAPLSHRKLNSAHFDDRIYCFA
jgi:hypothetical protein